MKGTRRVNDTTMKPTQSNTLGPQRLNCQLESMHGTDQGPATVSSCETLKAGVGAVSDYIACI